MGIKVGESNKTFRYGTNFDMSQNTALSLKFTPPSGSVFIIENPRVTAPNVPVSNPQPVGDFLANTYMEFQTITTDFLVVGKYIVCGTYTNDNTAPDEIFFGNDATFTVEEDC